MLGLGVLAGAANFSTGNPGLDFFYTLFNGKSDVPLFRSHQWNSDTRSCDFGIKTAGVMMVLSVLIGAGMAILFGAPYGA
jgi:urea transporter